MAGRTRRAVNWTGRKVAQGSKATWGGAKKARSFAAGEIRDAASAGKDQVVDAGWRVRAKDKAIDKIKDAPGYAWGKGKQLAGFGLGAGWRGVKGGARAVTTGYGLMIFFGLIIHIFQVYTSRFGLLERTSAYYMMHIILFIVLAILYKDDVLPLGIILVVYIFLPGVVALAGISAGSIFGGGVNSQTFIALYVTTFMYPLWFLYGCYKSEAGLAKFIFNGFLITLVVLLFLGLSEGAYFNDALDGLGEDTGVAPQINSIYNGFRSMYTNIKTFIETTPENLRKAQEDLLEYATGDYYKGRVEENVREQIGVYIENVQSAEKEFYVGDRVIVWGTLKAKTLDETEKFTVEAGCVTDEDDDKNPGEGGDIKPGKLKKFKVQSYDEEEFSCEFEENELDKGTHKILLNADFDFTTMAYLRTYFMDDKRRRAMLREGADILGSFKVSERDPIAVFTNGPVKIGAETTKALPVGVYAGKTVRLGVTLENQWEGKIKQVRSMTIEIPDELEIDSCDEGYDASKSGPVEGGFMRYVFDFEGDPKYQDIDKFRSVNCILTVGPSFEGLLGDTLHPATKYYRINAHYDYRLERPFDIEVRDAKGEGEGGGDTSGDGTDGVDDGDGADADGGEVDVSFSNVDDLKFVDYETGEEVSGPFSMPSEDRLLLYLWWTLPNIEDMTKKVSGYLIKISEEVISKGNWDEINLYNDIDFAEPLSNERNNLLYNSIIAIADDGFEPGSKTFYLGIRPYFGDTNDLGPLSNVVRFEVNKIDVIPPAKITELSASIFTGFGNDVTIEWKVPADDGIIDKYEIRHSTDSTSNEWEDFDFLLEHPSGNEEAGSDMSTIDLSREEGVHYYAIKAVDESGNWGEMSDIIAVTIDTD
jgi:hypothetical protein